MSEALRADGSLDWITAERLIEELKKLPSDTRIRFLDIRIWHDYKPGIGFDWNALKRDGSAGLEFTEMDCPKCKSSDSVDITNLNDPPQRRFICNSCGHEWLSSRPVLADTK